MKRSGPFHLFHVKQTMLSSTSIPTVKHTNRIPFAQIQLLPDTELAEDYVEQIFDIDPAKQLSQRECRRPQLLSR